MAALALYLPVAGRTIPTDVGGILLGISKVLPTGAQTSRWSAVLGMEETESAVRLLTSNDLLRKVDGMAASEVHIPDMATSTHLEYVNRV